LLQQNKYKNWLVNITLINKIVICLLAEIQNKALKREKYPGA